MSSYDLGNHLISKWWLRPSTLIIVHTSYTDNFCVKNNQYTMHKVQDENSALCTTLAWLHHFIKRYLTSLSPPLAMEGSVINQTSEQSCIGVDLVSVFMTFQLEFGAVVILLYIFVLLLACNKVWIRIFWKPITPCQHYSSYNVWNTC